MMLRIKLFYQMKGIPERFQRCNRANCLAPVDKRARIGIQIVDLLSERVSRNAVNALPSTVLFVLVEVGVG